MRISTFVIAGAIWLAAPMAGMAGDILFDADQYGEVTLRLPQSVLHLENILGSAENFEPLADYNPDCLTSAPMGQIWGFAQRRVSGSS